MAEYIVIKIWQNIYIFSRDLDFSTLGGREDVCWQMLEFLMILCTIMD